MSPQLDLLERMLRARAFEEAAIQLAAAGELPGPVHLSYGQEAVAAGVCVALRNDDYITTTHRGHGHVVAKGADLARSMAELFGRSDGLCRGKGGSMHLADISVGAIGANGIVGAGIPIAVGAALGAKLKGTDQVSVAFFGEGATNEGAFHEAMNLAAVWGLPAIFVCENNGYGQLTRMEDVTAEHERAIELRARAYGIPFERVDGNDCESVHTASVSAVARARAGAGPSVVEAMTYRVREHAEGFETMFERRDQQEIEEWRGRDPIERYRTVLKDRGVDQGDIDEISDRVKAAIDAALAFARASPPPLAGEARTDMWSESGLGTTPSVMWPRT